MTQQEYEQEKRECWEEFCKEFLYEADKENPLYSYHTRGQFDYIFDRAYALGKQEKDADTVIQGWVCRDKEWDKSIFTSDLFLAMEKPKRNEGMGMWYDLGKYIPLNTDLFPDLTWSDEPQEVELVIKRKKK